MNKKTKKKLILAGLAAIASGGIIYAIKKGEEEEETEKSGEGSDPIVVGPPTGSGDVNDLGVGTAEDDIFGGGGSGGGGGGGGAGGGANMTLCRGLDEEGNEIAELVNAGEACPESAPFSDDIEWDDFLYDSFNCFAYDEENEQVVAQEKDFTEVCAEDYPDFPFETLSSALTYAQDPSAFDGCTDPEALNYDEEAMMDDGSCIMEGDEVQGCTDENALNFNEFANVDDGSCEFGITRDEVINVMEDCDVAVDVAMQVQNMQSIDLIDGVEILSVDEVNDLLGFQCYDDLGQVIQAETEGEGEGEVQEEEELEPILGCTDSTADNFNPDATEDDGSCIFDTAVLSGCTDPTATNFDEDATEDDGTCIYDVVYAPETKTCYYFNDDAVIMEATFNLLPDESCWENVDPIFNIADIPTIRNGYFDSFDDAVFYLLGIEGADVSQQECAIFDETLPYPDSVSYSPLSEEYASCDLEYGNSIPVSEGQEAQIELYGNAIHEEWLLTQTTLCYGYNMDGVFEQDTPLLSAGAESCTEVGLFDTYEDAESAFANEFVNEASDELVGYIDSSYVVQNLVNDCPFTTNTDATGLLGLTITDGAFLIDDVNSIIGYQCYDSSTGLPDPPPESDFGCTDNQALNYDSSAVLDSGLCQYPEPSVITEDDGLISIPVGIITSEELAAGINNCQGISILDILSSADAVTGTWGEGYIIDDVNNIIGYACFDENAQPTGTPPISPTEDFGNTSAEIDAVMPNLEGLMLSESLGYCPTFNFNMLASLSPNSSVAEINEILGDTCFDGETGLNMYYDPPEPTSDILGASEAMDTYLICLGPNPLDPTSAVTLNTAMYPMPPTEFNTIIGFPCLDIESGAVINTLGETMPSTTSGDDQSQISVAPDVSSEPSDLSSDFDIVDDAGVPPTSVVGGTSEENIEENDLNSLASRGSKNFSGRRIENGGCLDPIALNYDESAEFDNGICTYLV